MPTRTRLLLFFSGMLHFEDSPVHHLIKRAVPQMLMNYRAESRNVPHSPLGVHGGPGKNFASRPTCTGQRVHPVSRTSGETGTRSLLPPAGPDLRHPEHCNFHPHLSTGLVAFFSCILHPVPPAPGSCSASLTRARRPGPRSGVRLWVNLLSITVIRSISPDGQYPIVRRGLLLLPLFILHKSLGYESPSGPRPAGPEDPGRTRGPRDRRTRRPW